MVESNGISNALLPHSHSACVQVRYLGLLENVRVRRAGFASRQRYERFVER